MSDESNKSSDNQYPYDSYNEDSTTDPSPLSFALLFVIIAWTGFMFWIGFLFGAMH